MTQHILRPRRGAATIRLVVQLSLLVLVGWPGAGYAVPAPSTGADCCIAARGTQAAAQGAKQATTAFGRSVQSLKQQLGGGDGPWKRLTAHAEGATSQSKRLQGATSIEEVFVHQQTNEHLIRHTIVRDGEILHETFRPFAKFGAP